MLEGRGGISGKALESLLAWFSQIGQADPVAIAFAPRISANGNELTGALLPLTPDWEMRIMISSGDSGGNVKSVGNDFD